MLSLRRFKIGAGFAKHSAVNALFRFYVKRVCNGNTDGKAVVGKLGAALFREGGTALPFAAEGDHLVHSARVGRGDYWAGLPVVPDPFVALVGFFFVFVATAVSLAGKICRFVIVSRKGKTGVDLRVFGVNRFVMIKSK